MQGSTFIKTPAHSLSSLQTHEVGGVRIILKLQMRKQAQEGKGLPQSHITRSQLMSEIRLQPARLTPY